MLYTFTYQWGNNRSARATRPGNLFLQSFPVTLARFLCSVYCHTKWRLPAAHVGKAKPFKCLRLTTPQRANRLYTHPILHHTGIVQYICFQILCTLPEILKFEIKKMCIGYQENVYWISIKS